MRALFATTTAICIAACVSGCARFAFYSNADLTGVETGIKFYTPKPYLLVAHNGATDKPNDISVVYIPDLSHPVYAKPKVGIGSNNLTLTLSNGMLTTLGQQTDSKLPELITALGGFATSLATARKTIREASRIQAAPDYNQVSGDLAAIANDLSQQFAKARANNALTQPELQAVARIVNTLQGSSQLLSDPTTAELNAPAVVVNMKNALDTWDKQIKPPTETTRGIELQVRLRMDTLHRQTQAILANLVPKEPEAPIFSLYEIDNSSGVTFLKEAKF